MYLPAAVNEPRIVRESQLLKVWCTLECVRTQVIEETIGHIQPSQFFTCQSLNALQRIPFQAQSDEFREAFQ